MKTILLVEDDGPLSEMMQSALQGAGYGVSVAHRGSEAVLILHANLNIDLVLLDKKLPGTGGSDLARVIRQMAPTIKIGFVTGQPEEMHTAEEPTLFKPFQVLDLLTFVRGIIGSPG